MMKVTNSSLVVRVELYSWVGNEDRVRELHRHDLNATY
jgi:hypothetical protein